MPTLQRIVCNVPKNNSFCGHLTLSSVFTKPSSGAILPRGEVTCLPQVPRQDTSMVCLSPESRHHANTCAQVSGSMLHVLSASPVMGDLRPIPLQVNSERHAPSHSFLKSINNLGRTHSPRILKVDSLHSRRVHLWQQNWAEAVISWLGQGFDLTGALTRAGLTGWQQGPGPSEASGSPAGKQGDTPAALTHPAHLHKSLQEPTGEEMRPWKRSVLTPLLLLACFSEQGAHCFSMAAHLFFRDMVVQRCPESSFMKQKLRDDKPFF